MKIGIVAAQFNADVTNVMLEHALESAKAHGVEAVVVKVPGSFELPLAAKRLLDSGVDGVAVLGAIVQGGTSHDEVIAFSIAPKLLELSLQYGKPVTLGVSGPRMSKEQARARAAGEGRAAMEAAIVMAKA